MINTKPVIDQNNYDALFTDNVYAYDKLPHNVRMKTLHHVRYHLKNQYWHQARAIRSQIFK